MVKRSNLWLCSIVLVLHLPALLSLPSRSSDPADNSDIPQLAQGDVVLCDLYPRRTTFNTSRTVYQIARLGHVSVAAFQKACGLRPDNIIGPKTQTTAAHEYHAMAGNKAGEYNLANTLRLGFVRPPGATDRQLTLQITNESQKPIRILGRISYDERGAVVFTPPSFQPRARICTTHADGRIAISTVFLPKIRILAEQRILAPGKSITAECVLPEFGTNQAGNVEIGTEYLDAELNVGTIATSTNI